MEQIYVTFVTFTVSLSRVENLINLASDHLMVRKIVIHWWYVDGYVDNEQKNYVSR